MVPSAYFTNSSSPFASWSADRSFQTLRAAIATICHFVYPSVRGWSPSPLIITSQRNNNVTSLAVIILIIVPPSSVLVHHERVFWHWTRIAPQQSKVHLPNHFPKLRGSSQHTQCTSSIYGRSSVAVVAIRVVVVTRQSCLTGVWFGQAKSGDRI